MPPTSMYGALADEIVTELEDPTIDAKIDAMIASGEKSLLSLVTAAIKEAPPAKGLLGMILPTLETGAENYAAAIVAKFPAEVIRGWLIDLAKVAAKNLGG